MITTQGSHDIAVFDSVNVKSTSFGMVPAFMVKELKMHFPLQGDTSKPLMLAAPSANRCSITVCGRSQVTFLSTIHSSIKLSSSLYFAAWQFARETRFVACDSLDWLADALPATCTRWGVQRSGIKLRHVCSDLLGLCCTNLTCMQGMSARPCWPDSVLAVTHLLLCLP